MARESAFERSETLLREGDLDSCIESLQEAVRGAAADVPLRVFLAQAYCVGGLWKKALTQLDVLAQLDAGAVGFAMTCKSAIHCEGQRLDVMQGKEKPLLRGEPRQWIALLIDANAALASGDAEKAASLREKAMEQVALCVGRVGGSSFEWIIDLDSRLGPIFEMYIAGRYCWVPMDCVRQLDSETPANLQDTVWMPLRVTWHDGGSDYALMPVRYPLAGTDDSQIKLSRRTEWEQVGADTYVGHGQRMFGTSGDDVSLLDVRTLMLEPKQIGEQIGESRE